MNVLFIDKSVPDFQVFVDSVNSNTIPIVYTNNTPPDWILPNNTERIGIVFIYEPTQLFGPNNTFLIPLLQKYSIKNVDFLACNTLPLWKSYYDTLYQETGVIVGASNNQTGNIQYGGDWILESTGQDIEFIYFTKSIEYYKYLLDYGTISIALLNDGTVWTTGRNTYGMLGLGTNWPNNVNSSVFQKTNMSNVVSISSGFSQIMALTRDGTVWTVGNNDYGQLGLGTAWPTNVNSSVFQKTNMSNVVSISSGFSHNMVLQQDGTVWSCGYNMYDLLGLGTTWSTNVNSSVFQKTNMSNANCIVAGRFHSMALTTDGTVWTVGNNDYGALSLGKNSSVFQKTNMSNVVSITAGTYNSTALTNDGRIWGCGYSYTGETGMGVSITYNYFLPTNMSTVASIYSGISHSMAIKTDGTIWSTGNNAAGQLGLGTNANASYYTKTNMSNVISISANFDHSIALTCDGTVWSTGNNTYGQLGLGTNVDSSVFLKTNMSNVAAITSKPLPQISPIIRSDGTLYTVGNNIVGQSGTNTQSFLKSLTYVDNSVSSVGATRYGMLYLKNNLLYYSGYNQYGELGTTNTSTFVSTGNDKLISVISNVVYNNVSVNPSAVTVSQFSAGLDHSLFLNTSSMVYASGFNIFGQLGLGNTTNTSTLTVIPNMSNVTLVETGYDYSAVVSNNQVYTFGNNTYGQLGLGTNSSTSTPILVPNMSSVSSIACGSYHTLFLSNNQVYSCGLNTFGQLGLGTSISQTTPMIVSRLINIVSISAGGNNSAAIDSVGNLWLWGQDYTSTPVLTKSQVTYVNVTLSGIFYVANNTYCLLKGDLLTFSYSDGLITLASGSTIPFSVRSNICFLADTPITTDQGDIPIVNLNPNKHTIRGKRIVAITETFSTDKYLVVVEKDALFTGCPNKKTVMSKEHKILFQGKMIEACLLINETTIHRIPYNEEKLYNVLLEDHGKMKVNNLIVETLDPTNMIGKVFKAIHEATMNP